MVKKMFIHIIVYLSACASFVWAHLHTVNEQPPVKNANFFEGQRRAQKLIKYMSDVRNRGGVKKLIINGWKASPGKYSFMVKVQANVSEIYCGGSLISPFVVLTAAHCVVENGTLLDQNVYPYDCKNEVCRHDVKKTIYHQDFNRETLVNDIAIIKLTTPFSASYRPIKLPDYDIADPQYEGTQVSLAGWGETEKLSYPKDLMETKVNIISNKECQEIHKGHKPEKHFCAGSMESDSCFADSGGPLFLRKEKGEYVVFGIVSYGDEDCADPFKKGERAGAYSNVFRHRDWITGEGKKLFGKLHATTKRSTFGLFGEVTVHVF